MAYHLVSRNVLPLDARQGLRRQQLASISAPGSIAARNDPNQPGSILSRKYPGLFGRYGSSNPDFVAQQKFDQHTQDIRQGVDDANYRLQLSDSSGLRQRQLDQGIEDYAYRTQRLQSMGLRKPLSAPAATVPMNAYSGLWSPYDEDDENGY